MRMESNTSCDGSSLFEVKYEATVPLRKYEALIRVDMEGKPLPRRLLSPKPPVSQEKPVELPKEKPQDKPQPTAQPKPQQPAPTPQNELKRSLPPTVETKHEPKKKQPKGQSKITSFFNKS